MSVRKTLPQSAAVLVLILDGVYVGADGGPFFRPVKPPMLAEME